jgi:3',5'-cyclic-AMP phosphodiesterase
MTAPSKRISLLHITDTHIMATPDETLLGVKTAYYFNAVMELASSSGVDFDLCLITGDLAQDPEPNSYQYMLARLQKYNIPCICLPGNHDDFGLMQSILSTELINCRKRTVLGNWQIIQLNSQIINSSDGCLSGAELSFLEKSLKDNPDLFTLVAVHHNCIPCGSSWMDVMMIKNSQELFDIIERYPTVKTIISGHIHQSMDIQIGSVRVLSTPSTCFQFEPKTESFSLDNASPGYRRIDLYQDGVIDTEIVRLPEKLTGLQTGTQGY